MSLIDATPYVEIVRYLMHHGHTGDELAALCGVGHRTIYDLKAGKSSLQEATADKLVRMVMLLPSETP